MAIYNISNQGKTKNWTKFLVSIWVTYQPNFQWIEMGKLKNGRVNGLGRVTGLG